MVKPGNIVEKQTKLEPGDIVKIISGVDIGRYAIILKDTNKLKDIENIYIFSIGEKTWYYRQSLKKVG